MDAVVREVVKFVPQFFVASHISSLPSGYIGPSPDHSTLSSASDHFALLHF